MKKVDHRLYPFPVIFFLLCLIFLTATAAVANIEAGDKEWANALEQLKKLNQQQLPPVLPVSVETLKDEICKYVENPSPEISNYGNNKLVLGLEGIYIYGSLTGVPGESSVLLKRESYSEGSLLAKLASCVLIKRLAIPASPMPAIPVFAPARNLSLMQWPEAQEVGKLIVWVDIGFQDTVYLNQLYDAKLAVLRVHFFRSDIHAPENMAAECSEPFPVVENNEQVLKFVSRILESCLWRLNYTAK